MKCGIYKIENIKTGSIYVGQSIDLASRSRDHISDLIKGRGVCAREVGARPQDWTFSIIEQCEEEQLDERERYWIAHYNGLNRTTGGRANYTNKKKINKFLLLFLPLCVNPRTFLIYLIT